MLHLAARVSILQVSCNQCQCDCFVISQKSSANTAAGALNPRSMDVRDDKVFCTEL